LNKSELIEEIASRTGLTKRSVAVVLDTFTEAVIDSLARGEKVTLTGFGSFVIKKRKTRQGVNPRTGEKIAIKAKEIPEFRPGKELKKLK